MNTVTRWFSIDDDGQPEREGWYEVLYLFDTDECDLRRRYWDGHLWLCAPGGARVGFGNHFTRGERWRGLAEKPK